MTDVFTPAERSRVMAAVRGKDTGPELAFAALLRAYGVKHRRHVRRLPGTPDFVVPAARLVIFIHGCFWHGHAACGKGARLPKTRRAFWRAKIARNQARDARDVRRLRALDYAVFTFWECGLRQDRLPARLRTRLGLPADPAHPAHPAGRSRAVVRRTSSA